MSTGIYPGAHRGEVTAVLITGQGRILSAGEDGFLEIWNNRNAEERFQVSPYKITSMVLRPGKPEVTIVESDGLSLNRISAWNYETKANLFTLRFIDPISYINYSAQGSFLMVSRGGRTSVAFIHSETGEVLESPEALSGAIVLAATGRTERVMICYLSSGILSYWNLETGTEMQRFIIPSGIVSPVFFGNNRFLAGFDPQGLLVIDAVTGVTLTRETSIKQGSLFTDIAESDGGNSGSLIYFYCLTKGERQNMVYRMAMDSFSRLTINSRMALPSGAAEPQSASSLDANSVILGTRDGNLWLLGRSGGRRLETGNPEIIIDAAVSSSSIAFINENGKMGYIPLNYLLLENDGNLNFENILETQNSSLYLNIISEPSIMSVIKESVFLLWQNSRGIPIIKTLPSPPYLTESNSIFLDKLSLRYPIRSADMIGSNILFLDASSAITVFDYKSFELRFNYSAPGAMDACFIDLNTIIIARNTITGNTPFMTINIITGETVPLNYPALMGIKVFRNYSGALYGAVVNQSIPGGEARLGSAAPSGTLTAILGLDTSNPEESIKLVELNGEDSSFSMAESRGNLASNLGNGAAAIYSTGKNNRVTGGEPRPGSAVPSEIIAMERSMGLPVKILDGGGQWFIVLDGEGGLCWHNIETGKILAVFRVYQNFWVLEKFNINGTLMETLRGN
ncbi:MAG: WD40 repeat domain-containing protein, partial [Treponema sp.]|nr:WD40 repeat domain-containing protein [Treponema sp.]